jgi:hypothetical protein
MIEYSKDNFESIKDQIKEDQELNNFLEDINSKKFSFASYPEEKLKYFAQKIYELRKN